MFWKTCMKNYHKATQIDNEIGNIHIWELKKLKIKILLVFLTRRQHES